MATLSTDTGGKAFFDSNDFAPAFAQVERDTSAYYASAFIAPIWRATDAIAS